MNKKIQMNKKKVRFKKKENLTKTKRSLALKMDKMT